MNELTFAEPNWLWGGLLLLPLLLLRLFSHLRTARQLPGLVSPRLAHRLVNGAGQARRWTVFVLQSLALACLLAALSRPQMGYEEIESEFDARNLLLAIDTSRSMMADDLAPNRLSRAKLAAKDIVLSLPDDRIGLVAFAGKPFLQAPLTVDHEAVLEAIDQLDTETIPRGGTNLSAAVALSIETVEEAKLGPSALVLFSDGEALEGLGEIEKIRERAADAGLSLLAVGVGTAEGAIIPETDDAGQILPGVFVKDENGQVVRTRLTTEALRALAADGGTYLHLGGAASLTQVVDQIRRGIASSREDGETTRRPIERFLWPLSAAAVLLVLSHVLPLLWLKPAARRTSSRNPHRAVSLFLCLAAASVSAQDDMRELAETKRQIAELQRKQTELEQKIANYERRLAEARLPSTKNRLRMGLGAVAYQNENYDQALETYVQALASGNDRLRRDAHYNIGNTLYRRGETILEGAAANPDQIQSPTASREARDLAIRDWESAIEHFESSLALAPDNAKAMHNRDYVKKRLEELKEQQEKEEEQQQKQEEQKKDEENQDEEKQEKQDPSDQDQNQKQDGSEDSKEKSEDQKSEGQSDESDEPDKSDKPDESDQSDGSNQPDNPNPGEPQPQEEPEAPQDGTLESTPPQSQQDQSPPNPTNAAEAQANPLTGYSPTEARQLLEALADETEVKPLVPLPARGEKFKNW